MVNAANKMKVYVNKEKNRLYCSWNGNVSKNDLDSFFTDIRFAVADLQPAFAVINDLTNCNYSELSGIPVFQRIMQYLVDRGMKDIVRVVKHKSLIYSQFSNLSLRKQGYIPTYVQSIEAADNFLDNQSKRTNIRLKMLAKEIQFKISTAWTVGLLLDLSLSGCAIQSEHEIPGKGKNLEISFSLNDKKKIAHQFSCNAEVTRVFKGGFAVAFDDTEALDLKKLSECMAQTVIEDL